MRDVTEDMSIDDMVKCLKTEVNDLFEGIDYYLGDRSNDEWELHPDAQFDYSCVNSTIRLSVFEINNIIGDILDKRGAVLDKRYDESTTG